MKRPSYYFIDFLKSLDTHKVKEVFRHSRFIDHLVNKFEGYGNMYDNIYQRNHMFLCNLDTDHLKMLDDYLEAIERKYE